MSTARAGKTARAVATAEASGAHGGRGTAAKRDDRSTDVSVVVGSSTSHAATAERGRSALRAASLAFFVDAFDAYVPVLALAPAQVFFLPPSLPVSTRATLAYIIFFTISWMGRPIGAFIFGHFSDTIGRRRTTLISVAGFGACTLAMALLPGYAQWGLAAIAAFGVLRLIGGIFIGGEYTGAAPLAVEYAPKDQRGLWGSLCNIGYPAALAANTGLTYLLLQFFPAGGPDAPYSLYGWRIAFVIGALLAFAVFAYYYRAVPESDVWITADKSAAPLKDLFGKQQFPRFAQVFMLMLGAWLTLNPVAGTLGTLFRVVLNVPNSLATVAIFASTLLGATAFPFIGMLGQNISRRTLFMIIGGTNVLVTPPLYVWLVASGHDHAALLITLTILIQIPTLAVWALVTAYITESFPTKVRASGYGLGFSLATIRRILCVRNARARQRYALPLHPGGRVGSRGTAHSDRRRDRAR